MTALSVIIVTYNSAHEIKACLDSVLKQRDCDFEVIVIDNQSQDNTLELLRQYQDNIQLIPNAKNLGFGTACNQAFKVATGKFIYLLNPDTEVHEATSFNNIVTYLQAQEKVGLLGTKIVNTQGEVDKTVYYQYPYEKHITASFQDLPGEIAWLLGASVILPRTVYEQVNGFDENFFLYGDEVDLCLRIRQQGYHLGYLDDVVVTHIGGASEKATPLYDYWIKKQHGFHNFIRKHYLPEDVQIILKKDLTKARFRLVTLCLSGKSGNTAKYHRYKAIYDSSKVMMKKHHHDPGISP